MMALMLLLSTTVFGQLTGTKNIPGDYATLTAAIADLNTQGVGAGGVTFSLLAGYTETFATPTAGLITATGTSTSPIIFMKNGAGANPTITAATGVSTTVDGIIVIKGGDYISFYNIDLSENAANVDATTQMEWGYAILKASITDGAKNINISNCTVILNKANTASVGIYANNHTDANTTALVIADVLGTNQNIKINGNTINNCYQGIYVKGFTTTATYYDSGLEIGSTSGNIIANYGGAAVGASGMYITGQTAPKIENNNITLAAGTTTTAYGINVAAACIGDLLINLNTVSVSSGAATSNLVAISNAAPIATVVNITNNTIENCNYLTATTGSFYGIYEQAATTGCTVNITSNIVRTSNLGSLITAGSGTFYGIHVTGGTPTAVNVNNNAINGNVNSGTTGGTIYGVYINKGTTQTANNNSIYDNSIAGTGIAGSFYGIRSVTGTVVHNLNNIYNNSIAKATATSGVNYGIYNFAFPTNETYNSNTIYNLTSQGTNAIAGIMVNTSAGTRTIANNTIYGLSTNGLINGVSIASSSTSLYKNKIYNLSGNGASSTVYGITISSGATNNVYNNFVSDLKAPAANVAMAIAGIYVAGGTTANLYYNSIYINATSTGALFGTAGIYASTSPTVDMRNNIIVNTSTPMGATGYTAAYRRSSATMTTHAATSNNNCFYAGTPGTNNVIYYDGTTPYVNFGDIAPIFGTKDNVSFSVMPPFVNVATTPYDLKLQAGAATMCESGGQRITTPAITDDFEGTLRFGEVGYVDGGAATDVGADEFIGIPIYTCVAPTPGNTVASANAICLGASTTLSLETATTGTGVSYQWQSSLDGTSYTNGPTTATWTVTPSEATYYKCIVTCVNGPVSGTSTPVQITFVQTAPATTPGARCGTGIVTLAASAATGTLNWYTAATGGTSIFTGSPYNANVSSTTTYYVGAENPAPANITIGAGALTTAAQDYRSPFDHYYGGMKSQYLVKASELNAAGLSAGNITALSFNVVTAGTTYNGFNLSIGTTALTALTTTIQTGLSSVYTVASVTPTTGVYTITFATPYLWDGTSNIIVETCWSNNNGGGTTTTVKYDNAAYAATSYYRADNLTPAVLCAGTTASGTLSTRPQMIFAGVSTCSSPRTAVIATVNTAPEFTVSADLTVCNDAIAPISVTSPLANYDMYVWTPAAGLFTDAAATVPYVDGASATTVYAKTATASVTSFVCLASNALLCAKTDTAVITVLPATPVITAVTSPICVSGTSALTVAPATNYGAATFQWNNSTDNVSFAPIFGHITLNDITDVITATTYYKLTIKDGAGATCVEPTVSVVVVNPQIVSTTPATRCGIGSVTVGATGSADVTLNWYNQAVGGTLIGTGAAFTTNVSSDTNFYVEAVHNLKPTCISTRTSAHVTMTPAPVLTLSAAQTVCNNAVATISVTSTLADYDTYTWTPIANLYTDAAATVPYVAGASASTVYVKSTTSGANVYTCSASNAALCANNATTTVNIRTAINITAAATPASICAGGSANLDATVNQVLASHNFSASTGTYTPLVGGTSSTATGDDGIQLDIPIGFNFTHFGNTFTTFSISTNGAIKLGATAAGYTNALATNENVIASMWDDNNLGTGSITYLVTGTTPNQVLTVEWNNVSIGGSGSSSASTNQYQIQLFEGTNNIKFNYGTLDASNGISASIGITGIVGQFISVTPSTTTSISTTTANNSISSVANIPSGTSYLFAPNIPSYTYSWKTGATEIATTLSTTVSPAANTDYTFSVIDGNACSVTSPIVTVSVSPVLVALTPVGVTCNGGNDGSFTEGAITCGIAPFTYSVDGGAFGLIPTNLTGGNHTVIIKDAGLNVSASINLVIPQPSPVEVPTVNAPIVACQGATTAVLTATTGTIVVPFNVTAQPVETNSAPGNVVATATIPAIPAGSTITNVTLSYPGITANGSSWKADVNLGLSGAVANSAAPSTGASNSSGTFTYTRILTTPTIDLAGGNVNLLYWDDWSDNVGDEATFPLGNGVATLTITYTPAAIITWYDAATAGNVLGTGTTLEAIGTSVLPNGNTPGIYNFYAEGSLAACVSPTRALVSVTISAPSVGGTATAGVDNVCSGTGDTITLTGYTGNIQWQSSTDGTTWNNVAGETTATLATGNLTAKTYYQAVVTSGTCASTVSSIDSVGVITAPVAGTLAGGATVCSDANSTLMMLTGYTGATAGWESSLDGLTWTAFVNPADNFLATNLTVTTHYRVKVVNGICSVYSNEVIVTVTPLPTAAISYANAPFCSSNTASEAVTLVGTTGGVYSSTTGLTIDGATGAIIPSTSTPGAYLVTYTIAAAGGCGVVSDDINISITTAPTADITYAGSPFINNVTTPQAVTLVGSTGGVYSSTTGLTIDGATGAIIPSTSTVGTYVVTYTIAAAGGCGIVTDTANVVINAEICNAPTALVVSAINAAGASLSWTNGGTETAWNIRYKKVVDATYTNVNNTTTKPYVLTGLQANTAYVWNVQAICSASLNSAWSADNTFTTTVGVEENSLNGLSVYSYNKQVNVINNGNILVKAVVIYDMLGQEVGTYAINSTDNVLINSDLTIGNYVVKVITETKVSNYKLFIK